MGLLDGLKMVMVDFVRILTIPPIEAVHPRSAGVG
jgi:hypothetical protein